MDGAAAAALLGDGEEHGRDGRKVGGPMVVTARVGVAGTGGANGGGSVLRRGVGATVEREPPEKILQLKAVCIVLPFCIKYKPTGPPNSTRGLPLFIYE